MVEADTSQLSRIETIAHALAERYTTIGTRDPANYSSVVASVAMDAALPDPKNIAAQRQSRLIRAINISRLESLRAMRRKVAKNQRLAPQEKAALLLTMPRQGVDGFASEHRFSTIAADLFVERVMEQHDRVGQLQSLVQDGQPFVFIWKQDDGTLRVGQSGVFSSDLAIVQVESDMKPGVSVALSAEYRGPDSAHRIPIDLTHTKIVETETEINDVGTYEAMIFFGSIDDLEEIVTV